MAARHELFNATGADGGQNYSEPIADEPAGHVTLPGSLVVVVHAYYMDVFDEICALLRNIPFRFDLDVATPSAKAQQQAKRSIRRHGITASATVRVCPNRGRNFGTFLAEFSPDVLRHDFVLHLHTKKSLYAGGEQEAWRNDLYAALAGDRGIVAAICKAFTENPAVGVIYPEIAPTMPYWAHHWLSNGHLAQGLFDRLGVSEFQRTGYLDYPVGGMFWARVNAIRPLFEAKFRYDDFPPEAGQNDGTLAHAIERCIVQVAKARDYTFSTVDMRTRTFHHGYSPKNLSAYADQTPAMLDTLIGQVDLVSFDVFDTLIMRPSRAPDAVLRFVGYELAQQYPECHDFFRKRKQAEDAARAAKQHRGDVTIDEIYAAFPEVAQWPEAVVAAAQAHELETEARICQPREAGVQAALAAKAAGKRCIVVSDTYLTTAFVQSLLAKVGLDGMFDAYYISSERQARKDRGDLWQLVLDQEHVTPSRWLHIGDNEHSDIQLATDRGIRAFHLMNPAVLAQVRGFGQASAPSDATWPSDLALGPVVNRIGGNPFLEQKRLRPIHLKTAEDVGYVVFGPIAYGFTAWLAHMLLDMDIDHAYFLSREGYGLRRCYEAMRETCPELGLPPSTYFLSSRRTVLAAAQGRQFAPHLLLENKDWRGSLSGLLRSRIGLSLPPIVGADEIPVSFAHGETELSEYLDALSGRIVAHGRQELATYLEYCQTAGLSTAQSPAVIDIGYSATIQRGLQMCLERGITGLYMATFNTADEVRLGGGVARGFFTESGEPWQPRIPMIEHNLLLEAVFTAPNGQFLTFERGDERGDGGLTPLFKGDTRSPGVVETILAMQQGAENYCRDLLRAYGSALVSLPSNLEAIQEPLRLLGAHGITVPRNVQETFVLEDDFTGRMTRELEQSLTDAPSERNTQRDPQQSKETRAIAHTGVEENRKLAANTVLRKAKGAARRAKRLIRPTQAPKVGGEKGSIEMWVDSPSDDQHLDVNVVQIKGWAFSHAGSVARVDVFLDHQELGQLEYGQPRIDVMDSFHLPSERCGFAGVLNLPKDVKAGRHDLRISVRDDHGRRRTSQRTVVLSESGQAAVETIYWIDAPAEDITTTGRLEVSGWAFNPTAPIRSVVCYLDGAEVSALTHGIARDDVYKMYPTAFARMSGFRGEIEFQDSSPGKHELTLRFTTHKGATAVASRTVVVRPKTVALLEVEGATWLGDTLTVRGFTFLPGKRLPWMVSAYAGGKLLGTSRVKRSRPDVRQRFPDVPGAAQSGFELVCAVPAPQSTRDPSSLTLTIQCADVDGQIAQQDIMVTHRPDERAQTLAACSADLEDLIWQVRLQAGVEPSILNLAAHYPLAAAFPACDVFSLPGKGAQVSGKGGAPLLSAETQGMADIVVADGALAQEAISRGVARYVTATLGVPASAAGHTSGAVREKREQREAHRSPTRVEWNPRATVSSVPSVSIIIPVYNQIGYTRPCVERVLETVRPYIPLEVIVVDDCSTDETPAVIAELVHADARVRYVRNETNLGFLRSSNYGAEVATGDVLVFLNNDTLPESRWIEPLLDTLQRHPEAGAVGGKLMYPDGTLQEAGGVIYNTGDGANFGRTSVYPEHPLYNTLREVDYCSGALLATPRELFFALGRFDERYAPAYFEDSDYCFKVREAGRRVYYQPESAIVHFEGVSNGRDTGQGVKQYQVVNRARFLERWQDALQRQGPPPTGYDHRALNQLFVRHERECDAKTGAYMPKRALVVFPAVPDFNHQGGSRQHSALIDFLLEFGWHVTVVATGAFANKGSDDMYIRRLRQLGIQVYAGYRTMGAGDNYVEDFAQIVREGNFQLALLAPWMVAQECMPALRSLSPETRIFVNTMDLHFLRDVRQSLTHVDAQTGEVMIPPALGNELIRELNTYAKADLVTTVSEEETAMLRDFLGASGTVELLRHMEAVPASHVPAAERRGMLFVGNFLHAPNIAAVEYLLSEVVPLVDPAVLREHPLTIIGTEMPESLRTLASNLEGIQMLGWVPEVTPYLHRARINLVPLLHGAGTKVKLIQSLMAGTPSVSTTIGAEGLSLEDGRQVLIADTPEQFARGMTRLATDDALWSQLALASRDHVVARHGAEVVRARFAELVEQLMRTTPKGASPTSTAAPSANGHRASVPRGESALVNSN